MSNDNGQLNSEQLAPHSVEAEEATLGAVLINPDALFEIIHFLRPDDFFIERHAWIYVALIALHERRDPIDYLTVVSELEQRGQLAETGGAAYILKLVNETPSSLNCEGYGRIVERMAIRRKGIYAAQEVARWCHSEETDIDEVVNKMEQSIFKVTDRRLKGDYKPMRVLVSESLDDYSFRERHKDNPDFPGAKTHLADLDRILGRLLPGKVYTAAGRPGMGKSSFVQGIAAEVARKENVALFSLEMDGGEITRRLMSRFAKVDGAKIRDAEMNEHEYSRYLSVVDQVGNLNLHIDDTPAITPRHLRSKLHRWILEYGIELVAIDYLQLMTTGTKLDDGSEVAKLTYLTAYLKMLAREFRVPFVVAAQLSRKVEERANKRPLLADLRGSGTIEQDSDCVMFLYRDEYYDEDSPDKGKIEIRIAKHREGKLGKVDATWLAEYTMLADLQDDPSAEIKERVRQHESRQ
jgi:replicative DNA helicase